MKALVTASLTTEHLERLRRCMEVEHEDWRRTKKIYFEADQLEERLKLSAADALIVEADFVPGELIARVPLRLIGCCRGDPSNVSVADATRHRVPVLYTPARNADAVADLTLAFMLALARNVCTIDARLRAGEVRFGDAGDFLDLYERFGGFELGGCTVGIVGFGAIGHAVARRLAGFGAKLCVYDPHVPAETIESGGGEPTSLAALLPRSDILTVHCPQTEETRNLIGADELRALPHGAFVLNLARASIIDEDALYDALVDGHLGGAALDVVRDEPVQSDNRFVPLPNVLLTPHLGGATRDVVRHQGALLLPDIEALLRGERPRHIANPDVLPATR